MAYDMVLDADVFGAAGIEQIRHTFRLLIETMAQSNQAGSINNWNISESQALRRAMVF